MNQAFQKVAVLGAGTMGSQIAAHLANVDIETLLLDLPSDGEERSAIAATALRKLLQMKPAPLVLPEKAGLIEVGNCEDDISKLSGCDWIIEAITERLDLKRQLWRRVARYRNPGVIVSTNTSGLPLGKIVEGFPEEFRKHFLGTATLSRGNA